MRSHFAKIYVAGHRGMVGSAIVRRLLARGIPQSRVITRSHAELDPSKAKQKLGWTPEITAREMCAEMVAHDLQQAKQHALLKQHGYNVNVSTE